MGKNTFKMKIEHGKKDSFLYLKLSDKLKVFLCSILLLVIPFSALFLLGLCITMLGLNSIVIKTALLLGAVISVVYYQKYQAKFIASCFQAVPDTAKKQRDNIDFSIIHGLLWRKSSLQGVSWGKTPVHGSSTSVYIIRPLNLGWQRRRSGFYSNNITDQEETVRSGTPTW